MRSFDGNGSNVRMGWGADFGSPSETGRWVVCASRSVLTCWMDERTTTADLERRLADAEAALRHANERAAVAVEPAKVRLNAFLVRFQEIVRGSLDPGAVAAAACRLVTQELGVDRAYWSEVDWTTREFMIGADYTTSDAEPISGRFPLDAWEPFSSYHLEGRPVVVADTTSDPRVTLDLLRGYEALGIQADLAVPVLAGDKLRSVLAVNQRAPRKWKPDEVALVQSAAAWCWAEVERARAVTALRESGKQQAFLLRLSDALRAEPDADAVADRALLVLLDHLRLDRCYITYYRPGQDEAIFPYQFGNDTVPPLPAKVRLSDFPEAYEQVLNRTLVVEDDFERRGLSEAERANSKALGMRAMVASTVRRGEKRPLASMVAVSSRPRRWSPAEIALVEEAAERTWAAIERARAEAALRESEERFQQFANASAAGLWIRGADTLAMEFVSPAIGAIYGVEPDALLGDVKRWAAMVVPDDRDAALGHLDKARHGDVAVHEFRIQRPLDGSFRWIRNTDFPLRDNGHITRIGGIAEDVTEAKLAAEHSAVLLAELQHRVRNIMAMIRSVTQRTGERAASVPDYAELLMGRLLALARVQALLTRAANVSVGIASIVHDEVSVQAQHEGQYDLDGPDVALSPKAAEVLTLAVHELATNALKYGALSARDGKVTVRWSVVEKRGSPWLVFDWTEEGAPDRPQSTRDAPRRRGFGSELIEARVPYELRGRGRVTIEPGGARCHLEFPLKEGASILETGAPQRTAVFGGALDMTSGPDLVGRRVLVVEDDFYLATDAARALESAGAEVMGPCATEEDARAEMDEQRPDAVVVDINLGSGPSFKLAETLKDCGIPFVFTTGYDAEVIPAEFAGVERLEKPFPLRQIVGAVAKLTTAA